MKVVTAQEMARIEKMAYAHGASEETFMNNAGMGVAEAVQRWVARLHIQPIITLLCGPGNNAGDAYVAGTILLEGGFKVNALALAPLSKSSPLCQLQSKRFAAAGGPILYVEDPAEITFGNAELLVDGILGTGFHGEVKGLLREAIEKANRSKLPILAIDIPSGVNGTTGEVSETAISATATLFLGLPKIGCFKPNAWDRVGAIQVYDFGLGPQWIEEAQEEAFLVDDEQVLSTLPEIVRTRHKYQTGYVVGLGGSMGMPGAPTMACFAALRSGAGIVRLFHPQEMRGELSHAPVEVILDGYQKGDTHKILKEMKRAGALFFGPGLGMSPAPHELLKELFPQVDKPCVIDAEALFVVTEKNIKFPPQAILTPHHGEMKKLLQIPDKDLPFEELLNKARSFAQEEKVTLVLKGAPTYILHHDQKPYICAHGDPGMATAGSGDVLSGIISGFLAQLKDPFPSACLGVQFHGMAGECAAEKWTSYCMVATDIIDALPQVFKHYLALNTKYHSTKLESPLSSCTVG